MFPQISTPPSAVNLDENLDDMDRIVAWRPVKLRTKVNNRAKARIYAATVGNARRKERNAAKLPENRPSSGEVDPSVSIKMDL